MSSSHVQTLANSIIGTAILAIPFCFAKCGVILSIFLLIISTIISRSTCHYLIKASIVTRRRNMEQLGFHMFGTAGKTVVELSVIGFLMGTCIAFFVVIGDLSPVIVSKIFDLRSFSPDSVRTFLIVLITIVVVIPLSFQKSIESLSFVCRASIGFYICLTLKTVFESFERFENDENWSANIELWNAKGVLQCIPIFSMSMSCQMQLFEVYETMSGSFDQIKRTVHQATLICCIVYCVVGFFGYLAFYNQTLSGNVLMNFSPSLANDAITIGFILSIACSFPLVISPCRRSLASFLHRKSFHSEIPGHVPESKYRPLTLFIIISTMIVGILIPSIELIISLVGSTIGILVCVIFPATCFVKIMKRSSAEKTFAQIIIISGFIIMILGTYANLVAYDSGRGVTKSGSHLEEKLPKFEAAINIKNPVENSNSAEIVKGEKKSLINEEVTISNDGIKKEDHEIAEEKVVEFKAEIQEKNEEIEVLKESKNQLEKEVKEMKEVLVKQNKETQDLVLQKFEEIAEKVEKIEKQSQDNSLPSGKEKAAVEEGKIAADAVKKALDALKQAGVENKVIEEESLQDEKSLNDEKASNDGKASETQEKASNDAKASNDEKLLEFQEKLKELQKSPELPAKLEPLPIPNDIESSDLNLLEIENPHKESLKVPEEHRNKPKISNDTLTKAPLKTQENRIDPIVKLIKSQEPLSYQIGEKMSENKKANATNSEVVKTKLESTENEIKNEMRRKRDTKDSFDSALNSLDKTLQNFELHSMIGRSLKEVDET